MTSPTEPTGPERIVLEGKTLEDYQSTLQQIERVAAWLRNLPTNYDIAAARETLERLEVQAEIAKLNPVPSPVPEVKMPEIEPSPDDTVSPLSSPDAVAVHRALASRTPLVEINLGSDTGQVPEEIEKPLSGILALINVPTRWEKVEKYEAALRSAILVLVNERDEAQDLAHGDGVDYRLRNQARESRIEELERDKDELTTDLRAAVEDVADLQRRNEELERDVEQALGNFARENNNAADLYDKLRVAESRIKELERKLAKRPMRDELRSGMSRDGKNHVVFPGEPLAENFAPSVPVVPTPAPVCPYLVALDEGTHYCALNGPPVEAAESRTRELENNVAELMLQRDHFEGCTRELEEALRKYGKHAKDCEPIIRKCSCGLSALLSPTPEGS